jgi:hypothetical protein
LGNLEANFARTISVIFIDTPDKERVLYERSFRFTKGRMSELLQRFNYYLLFTSALLQA